MNAPDPREGKLPKWAQAELDRLRRDLTKVREDFEEYADQTLTDDHVAVINPYDRHPKPVAFADETIRVYLDEVGGFDWLDFRREGRAVRVMASTGLQIVPSVTTSLTLSLTR